MASVLLLAGAATARAGTPGTDDPKTSQQKASSFAPHHTKSHVYGTPIAKPIVHKRRKHAQPSGPAAGPAAPIK